MDVLFLVQLTGLLAVAGVSLYALSDVLLLAAKVDLTGYPNLQAHARLLSGAERMVTLPEWRRVWGGLVGVLATPLVVAGLWPLYYGLAPAGPWAVWPVVAFFAVGFIIAPFVHGSFIYTAEYVQALNQLTPESQPVIVAMIKRQKKIFLASYVPVLLALAIGSIWFSVAVALGGTLFPQWMAAVNPVTALLAWMVVRRLVPRLGDWLEGAGFNIAMLVFFACLTATLWK